MRIATPISLVCTALLLSGCVTAIVGGLRSNSLSVTADPASVKPELSSMLADMKHLVLVTPKDNEVAVHFAEFLDVHGGYVVTTSDEPQGSMPAERRDAMERICKSNTAVDVVASSSAGRTDAGGASVLKGMVTGRASFKATTVNELLHCKSGTRTSFTVVTQVSQGLYNADKTALNRKWGEELGRLYMHLSGKEAPP